MLARRFACPPVNEAAYAPGGIPNADPKELTGHRCSCRPARDLPLAARRDGANGE